MIQLHNKNCYNLEDVRTESVHALVTDPPYGIDFADWDRTMPNPSIWQDCLRVLLPGGFGFVFSSIRLMHHMMLNLEESGFLIRDVIMWGYLNGMPKSRDVAIEIDKELGVESEVIGSYKYVQGYKKGGSETYKASKNRLAPASDLAKRYKGAGLGIKPAYEPVILIQKSLTEDTVAKNIIRYGTGALNLEETRIPYTKDDAKVGHNPHPLGRVAANVIRTDAFEDGFDKFFLVPKVRQHKDDFNSHPTIKPLSLMEQLIKLVSFRGQVILDPFMGSGSTGLACSMNGRDFIGYEINRDYYEIACRRIQSSSEISSTVQG